MAISYDEAVKIAQKFAEELNEKHKEKILAVFAIGSLGGDYYRPGQSDIDTVVITSCSRQDVAVMGKEIRTIADRYWKEHDVPKGFGAVVFAEEQLYPPYIANEELILEILRILTQSKLIYGYYDKKKIPVPDKQAMIDNENAFENWMAKEATKKADQGNEAGSQTIFSELDKQAFVNGTLWHIRRFLMINRDIIEFNKFKLIDLYLQNNPPIIDEEAFKIISSVLHNGYNLIDDEHMQKLSKWRDDFRVQMLKIVLGR